jgi:hypothetical protein
MLNGVAGVLLLTMAVSAAPDRAESRPESPQLVRARERAVAFLLKQLESGEVKEYQGEPGGVPSLVTLALLKSGVKPADHHLTGTLANVRAMKPRTTYVVALQTLVLCAADPKKDMDVIRRDVKWLEDAQIHVKPCSGQWSYVRGEKDRRLSGDNSNTQFALFALHEADLAGAAVSENTWRLALDHWIADQNEDGSWGYYRPLAGMGSETCAGLISVTVASWRVDDKAEREAARRALQRGQKWLTKNFTIERNPSEGHTSLSPGLWHFYYLRALERAARLTGQSSFGNHDWQQEGIDLLLKSQDQEKGSWTGSAHAEDDPVIATSLALLFLTPEPLTKPFPKGRP